MEWKPALVSFFLIFIAELGDKTQLTTMALAAQSRSPWMVFIGAMAALALACMLGVIAGEAVIKLVPPRILRSVVGAGFVGLGLLLLSGRV